MGRHSAGGPGRATTSRPSRRTHQPGAVPRGLGSQVAEGIFMACLRLASGMAQPRAAKSSSSQRSTSGSGSSSSPKAAATASRVTSSGVGPSPPESTTSRAWPSNCRSSAVRASRSSDTRRVRRTSTA